MVPFTTTVPHAIDTAEIEFQRLKTKIHEQLVESLDLSILGNADHNWMAGEIRRLATQACREVTPKLSSQVQQRIVNEYEAMVDEFGLTVMDATLPIPEQQRLMRQLVQPYLCDLRSPNQLLSSQTTAPALDPDTQPSLHGA